MTGDADYGELELIHSGRHHAVYRAVRREDGARVILKMPAASLSRELTARSEALLRKEHELLGRVRADGVARALDLRPVGDRLALVLADAGARSLREALRSGPLDLGAFWTLAVRLSHVVGRVHARRVVHRDLNPANIVIDQAGKATLVDFDVATSMTEPTGDVGARARIEGTLHYLAPEQTGRLQRAVDHRTDLYALGATFYELLTGAPPFPYAEPAAVLHAHLAQVPVTPSISLPAIPEVLSNVVLKLLAKMPEARYQSAEALEADLRRAHDEWLATGKVEPFVLGREDEGGEIVMPSRLYGRERESGALAAALERARSGAREVAVVVGAPGVGKSALVDELRELLPEGGRFLTGKFDPLGIHVPFAPLVRALRGVVLGLVDEPEAERRRWRVRVTEALGQDAPILARLLPEIERLIGAQPVLTALDPGELEYRLHSTMRQFVRLFADAKRPLVLFLDDLQWSDPGSLELFRIIATDVDLSHALLVGAYRVEDVNEGHPLLATLAAIGREGVPITTVEPLPLSSDALEELLSETLATERSRVASLTQTILRKTGGNPLYVRTFLRAAHQLGLLRFDPGSAAWRFDLAALEAVDVGDDIAALMVAGLERLPPATQELLKVAACLGGDIDVAVLAAAAGATTSEVQRALWSAVRRGLVVPSAPGTGASYRFVHDRVQQAAYSMLEPQERERLHLASGRLLAVASEERLFDAVEQLNRGAPERLGAAERMQIASLNHRAGQRARQTSAFASAFAYFRRGLKLLPDDAWDTDGALAFALHCDAAEAACLSGAYEESYALAARALEGARSRLQKAHFYIVMTIAHVVRSRHVEALVWAREGLSLFGLAWPETGIAEAVQAEMKTLASDFARVGLEELIDLPAMTDETDLACMELFGATLSPSWFANASVNEFIATKAVRLTFQRGCSIYSAHAVMDYGMMLVRRGEYRRGNEIGQLALELVDRFPVAAEESKSYLLFACFLGHWRAPIRDDVVLLRRALAASLRSGTLPYAVYAHVVRIAALVEIGTELHFLVQHIEEGLAFCKWVGNVSMVDVFLAFRQLTRCLRGQTRRAGSFEDDQFDEESFLARAQVVPKVNYLTYTLVAAYHFTDYGAARRAIDRARPYALILRGSISDFLQRLYGALTLTAVWDEATEAERPLLLAQIHDHERQLAAWAEDCPESFCSKLYLVRAEVARIEGRAIDALALFDRAAAAAIAAGFLQEEALANELCGRCFMKLGRRRVASVYLQEALAGYARWGASGKVRMLREQYPDIERDPSRWRSMMLTQDGAAAMDLASLVCASETVASEVALDRLLAKLMELCLETGGAARGVLALEERGELAIRAVGEVGRPVSLDRRRLSDDELPRSLVEQAARSKETLVLGDAAFEGNFTHDPYIAARTIRSALALPLHRQARLVGVLYLENELTSHVFSHDRVQLLRHLSSQIAIAIENSYLFEKLKGEVDERTRAETAMRFLAQYDAYLAESLDYETTLAQVARLVAPGVAEWCTLDLVDEKRMMRRVATVHADPRREVILRELGDRFRPRWGSRQPAAIVLRSGRALLVSDVTGAELERFTDGAEHAALMKQLGTTSFVAVPLIARGKAVGAITLGTSAPDARYGDQELSFAQELAHRAALAIDNARLYLEAREAAQLREEFLVVASHELRTPITSLLLSVQGLRGEAVSAEARERALAIIERQIDRLSGLVSDLLNVSRIQLGRLPLKLERVSFAAVVREVAALFADPLARSRCALSIEAPSDVKGNWDRARLEQVVTNLISNAIKFGAGKPIDVVIHEEGGLARLAVSDQGIGVAEERIPHIFERFEQAVSPRAYGGLGLGLYIVRSIVDAFGGEVWMERREGGGSTFIVELPCAGPAARARDPAARAPAVD